MEESRYSKLATALSAAQAEIKSIQKLAENPYFKSNYATLDQVSDYILPILAKHQLAVSHITLPAGDRVFLHTMLFHSSGESLTSVWPVGLVTQKPQELASAHTYARRYTLMGIVGLTAHDEDDDGNQASDRTERKAEPATRSLSPLDELLAQAKKKKVPAEKMKHIIQGVTGKEKSTDLTDEECEKVIKYLHTFK